MVFEKCECDIASYADDNTYDSDLYMIFYKHMNFRNQARVCLIKNCKKAQIMLVICLFQSFPKMSPNSYVKVIRLY